MRAYQIGDRRDGQLTLAMVERPDRVPGRGEAVIKVHATGIGARDMYILRSRPGEGKGAFNHPAPERVPLQDGAGEVIAIGEGVTRVKIGDRVIASHYPLYVDGRWEEWMHYYDFGNFADGFLQEQAVVPAECLCRFPDTLSYEEASTLQSSGLTPWRALTQEGGTMCGETVLTLGTGNVSIFALQIARMLGARVAITSSSDEKLERMRALGADITVNYRTCPDWDQEIMAQTGGVGADVVLNNVGFAATEKSLLSCATNGRVIRIGGIGEQNPPAQSFPNMVLKNLKLSGVTVGSRRMFEDFLRAVGVNRLKPVIDRVFAFDEALDAVRHYETGAKVGKVVIKVSG